jgi:hypothetical protein
MRRLLGNLCLIGAVLVVGSAAPAELPNARAASPKKQLPDRGAPAPAPGSRTPPPAASQALAVPPPEALLLMLRSALVALDHANKTNNYTVLRQLGGPGLQKFSAAQLSDIFGDLRSKAINLSPVAVATPQVVEVPTITQAGLLRLVGYFPTRPLQIHFETAFEPVNGEWKLFGLTVSSAPPPRRPSTPSLDPRPHPSAPASGPARAPTGF